MNKILITLSSMLMLCNFTLSAGHGGSSAAGGFVGGFAGASLANATMHRERTVVVTPPTQDMSAQLAQVNNRCSSLESTVNMLQSELLDLKAKVNALEAAKLQAK